MTRFRLSSSILFLLILLSPLFAFADTTMTLSPYCSNPGNQGFLLGGSGYTDYIDGDGDVGVSFVNNGSIHNYFEYFIKAGNKGLGYSNGVIEFDISGLEELSITPDNFKAELSVTTEQLTDRGVVLEIKIPVYPITPTIEVYDLSETQEDGIVTLNDYPLGSYIDNLVTNQQVNNNEVLTMDVTDAVLQDLENIANNHFTGFQIHILSGTILFANAELGNINHFFGGEYNGPKLQITLLDNNPTAISLSSFEAKQSGKKVLIKWTTATEINNLGFNILRSESESGPYSKINKKLIKAKGSSTKGASYKLKDKNITAGKTYWYKLEDIDSKTGAAQHDAVKVEVTAKKIKAKK